jgi:hypothetical protein
VPLANRPLKLRARIAEVEIVGPRDQTRRDKGAAGTRRQRSDRDDLARARHAQRTKHEAVGQTEHRRVGADADRNRDDGNEAKPGFFASIRTPCFKSCHMI